MVGVLPLSASQAFCILTGFMCSEPIHGFGINGNKPRSTRLCGIHSPDAFDHCHGLGYEDSRFGKINVIPSESKSLANSSSCGAEKDIKVGESMIFRRFLKSLHFSHGPNQTF
jgi:hypothetical protein